MELLEDLMLFGPSRRHPEKTVIEVHLKLDGDEPAYLQGIGKRLPADILGSLESLGVILAQDHPLSDPPASGPGDQVAWMTGGIALALQQHAGHRVSYFSMLPTSEDNSGAVVFEYEDNETGDDALELAFRLLTEAAPGLRMPQDLPADGRSMTTRLEAFMAAAPAAVLPQDTLAIIEAAARCDVPSVKLDRMPYGGLKGKFRVRPNGMLKLGHACRQHVVDGTFCVYRNKDLFSLVHDQDAVRSVLASFGAPLPARYPEQGVCISSRRAVRAADRIGYPVVVKSRVSDRSNLSRVVATGLEDATAVRAAAERALRVSHGVSVEAHAPGTTFKVLVSNGEVIATVRLEEGVAEAEVTKDVHPSISGFALEVAASLGAAMLTLTLVSTDITRAIEQGSAVVSMDVAPELDAFIPEHSSLAGSGIRRKAADGLVRFLFPESAESRIPIVTVTGTNGKTTVCALIAKIMQSENYVTGRAGTTGFFINDDCREFDDFAGGSGHHKVLESTEVEFAVLEAARGAATGMGFMYDWSDIALCTNVTEDHLFERGIDTVQEMADLKLSIMQRARHAVVLNADDAMSAGMLPRLGGRKAWMVSAEKTAVELRQEFGNEISCAVAETVEAVEWLVLYAGEYRLPVVQVNDIPITFEGSLRYNVSNALQAAAACYQENAALSNIRAVLKGFEPDHETSPGRMNFYHGLPFTVLMDYAHNKDSFRHLRSYVDELEVEGRKIVSLAVVGRMSDDEIMKLAGSLAGAFDHYICRNYPRLYGREPEEVPVLIRRGLMQQGVSADCISLTPHEDYVVEALDLCRPGDLFVLCASTANLHKEWDLITSYDYVEAG